MIRAWRVFKHARLVTDLLGEGSRLYGGRFNRKGIAVIYSSDSLALAAMEILVHIQSTSLLGKYVFRQLTFDESLIETLSPVHLPHSWRDEPPAVSVQQIGDLWVREKRSAVLRVPTALLPVGANFILNPAHADFGKVGFDPPESLTFSSRLIQITARKGSS